MALAAAATNPPAPCAAGLASASLGSGVWMNAPLDIARRASVCPHDCPSVCALDVEVIGGNRIGRVHGAADHPYTQGVVCAKVARYSERIHHPDRLTRPLRRVGPKGSAQFVPISWDEALDRVAEAFLKAERECGAESVWPYFYAGTMGLVMRDGIDRLTHVKRYSRFFGNICVGIAWPGYIAGTGRMSGISPAEMAKSEVVVIWGTNAATTQVNLMTHATRARKEHGAKIVAIDIYPTETMRQADLALQLKPGTDGALACAVMHALFRDGLADRDYMARFTDAPAALEAHLRDRTPAWASAITGLTVGEIEAFAALVGRHKRTFFRLGYGFSRQRNGAANMHAALCIPAVTGAWAHEGGGALHASSAVYKLDRTLIQGLDARDDSVRRLDQCRIGAILTGDRERAQRARPGQGDADPEHQSAGGRARPGESAARVRARGSFCLRARAVHDRHRALCRCRAAGDDVPRARRHLHRKRASVSPVRAEGDRSARRMPLEPRGYLRARPQARRRASRLRHEPTRDHRRGPARLGTGNARGARSRALARLPASVRATRISSTALRTATASFISAPTGRTCLMTTTASAARGAACPPCPTIGRSTKGRTKRIPSSSRPRPRATSSIRASTRPRPRSPARAARARSCTPTTWRGSDCSEGDIVRLGNARGEIRLHVRRSAGATRGVIVSEGLWDNRDFLDGRGVNTLTGADSVAPFGGAAFHDIRVWARADVEGAAQGAKAEGRGGDVTRGREPAPLRLRSILSGAGLALCYSARRMRAPWREPGKSRRSWSRTWSATAGSRARTRIARCRGCGGCAAI